MKIYKTKKDTDYLLSETSIAKPNTDSFESIVVDTKIKKQQIIGFGGAFTESSAYNLLRVNKNIREKAIKAYFDKEEGIGYNIGRVSIGGCDFSLNSYSYIDDYDKTLNSFNIDRDKSVIDLINDAKRYAASDIEILASPWTPPFWMKDNNSYIQGGKLKKEYYETWANYFVKFINAYQEKKINIKYVTIQNEPAATQRWDSCIYEAEDEAAFAKVLGKTLIENKLNDTKILIWDHNRDIMLERATKTLSDKEANKYIWGIAFHWYDNNCFDEVLKTHNAFPGKHLMFTEGCQEAGPHFGDYSVGERYGLNMIKDLRNYTEGYLDWNLFLDDTGGPNHVNNLCSAPIMIKIFANEIVKMPAYYYIGHISKFVKKGAYQIDSKGTEKLDYISFINNDNSVVVIIMNRFDCDIDVTLSIDGKNTLLVSEARSIQTLVFEKEEI